MSSASSRARRAIRLIWEPFDQRVGVSAPAQRVGSAVLPRHWSFLLGNATLSCFLVLVVTGLFLALFYTPSTDPTTYTGSQELYQGREVPAAFESILRMSYDVPGGLLIRRVHAAAAGLMLALAAMHLLRVVLSGAFRRPRELNYHIGWLLLLLTIGAAYTGHLLTFEVLAGTSMRILYTFLLSVPWVGESLALWAFGGEFPTGQMLPRMYAVHVIFLPALLTAGILGHIALVIRQSHTQMPDRRVDGNRTVVGEPMWPGHAAAFASTTLAVAGLLVLSSVLIPWADHTLHGPYMLVQATNASHPDWYLFWVFGAQRLYPGFSLDLLGASITGPFIMGVVLPGLFILMLLAYPWIERRVVGDDGLEHHVLQHPYDVPFRTGVVAGVSALLLVLSSAAATDVVARDLNVPVAWVVNVLRVATLVVPPLAAVAFAGLARRWLRHHGPAGASPTSAQEVA